MVTMNVVLSAINVWFIARLLQDRHDEAAFAVLEVRPDDAYFKHVLTVHGADIQRFQPDFDGPSAADSAYLVQRGDETVGVVVIEAEGETAHVKLDYVTPRYRDFSPGEFVWRRSELLKGRGFTKVITSPRMVGPYYERLGFHREGASFAP